MSGFGRVRLTYPLDALVSFHYFRDHATMAPLTTGAFRLIGDSGAYSALTQGAVIDLAEYADWCKRYAEHLCWAASLDVIGDPAGSWRNWRQLRERHDLMTVPTLHAGSDVTWLDRYAAEGVDLVGLGGMAGAGLAMRAFRWTVHAFRYARERHPHMRFHIWGVQTQRILGAVPAWSADSSGTLGKAIRFGQLCIFDPGTGRRHQVALADRERLRRLAPLLRRVYGIEPPMAARIDPSDRVAAFRFDAATVQLYATWLQHRHRVAAPAAADNGIGPIGTRLHMVAWPKDLYQFAADAPMEAIA